MGEARATPEGIDRDGVTRWFAEHAPSADPPLEFSLIAGGRSNLTFEVTDAGGRRWVLRRPPTGKVLATAHDMGREHRIITALAPTPVPVPPTVGYCSDEDVNGAPFYVMEFVDGHVVRDQAHAESAFSPEERSHIGEALVDVLVDIHEVDPDQVGLGDLGRKEGYVDRQLRRWYGQYQKSQHRPVPPVDRAYEVLSSRIPEQGPATIVHGDYRLDNTMLDDHGEVVAVLDWEICTLGDPLADVGLLCVYWAEPGDTVAALGQSATVADGFLPRSDLLERYAARSGRDVDDIGFYVAFGYWKLACILDGVHSRYAAGVMGRGDDAAELAALFDDLVDQLAAEAERRLQEVS